MKKRILAAILAIVIIIALGAGPAAAASGLSRIFGHNFTVRVEPIEVQVVGVSNTLIHPGESVTVIYTITNHSKINDHNLVGEQTTGIKSNWMIGNTQYLPGSPFMIGKGQKMTMEITFYPESEGEIPIEINISRISSTEKG